MPLILTIFVLLLMLAYLLRNSARRSFPWVLRIFVSVGVVLLGGIIALDVLIRLVAL